MKNRLFYLLMLLLTMVTQGAWAMGELTGRFSVNETKQVYFSQGNLQAVISSDGPTDTYNYTASKWKFAPTQWSYVGNNAGNNSFAAGTTVDLFGWVGTSASYDTYGLCTNSNEATFYGNSTQDALKSDWGALAIENGGNTANSGWRTLTRDEWDYLFNSRKASTVGGTADGRYAKAKVNNVAGVILFPNSYTHPDGVTAPTNVNTATANYTANKYSVDDWTLMETAGAVFLPAAGYRNNINVNKVGEYGHYWSSSPNASYGFYADRVRFYDNTMYLPNSGDRQEGNSVRLVKDVTLTTDDTGAILINCLDDWTLFADAVNKGNTFSDKTVKLTDDISGVTMMAGTEDHPFKGTFNGQEHKLTVDITSSGAAALFGRVADATILHLHVAGFVTTTMTDGADHTAGLIAKTSGEVTIHDVRVSATVTGHTYYGGFIGDRGNSPMINMMGCVFDGTLTENVAGETQHAGGFIGWGGSSPYIIISYSLFAGTCTIATNGSGAHNFHPVGYYSSYNYEDPPVILTPNLSHVYYTVAPSAQTTVNFGAALSYHEKQAYTISTSDANVTTLDIDDYLGYEFPTSGLNFYATGGIEYGSTFYAGNGEKVDLALAHKDAAVGQHFTGYAVTGGGTLDDNTSNTPTLTMTAANQTISAVYADNPSHNVTFDITETGWSTTPSGTAREGETVTVSYQGEHKVKSVTVNAQSANPIQVDMSKTGDTYSGTFTMPASDAEISTELYYKLSAEEFLSTNQNTYQNQTNFYLDRTLTKDVWNTFASPFAIASGDIETYFGAGAKMRKLCSTTIKEGNVLSLNFENATKIDVGYPYIVKPTVNVVDPTFDDVNDYINSYTHPTRTTYVDFEPTLGKKTITLNPEDILIMTSEGKLVHPSNLGDIKGYRGYFVLHEAASQARAFVINFGDGETTEIDATLVNSEKVNSDVYDLQGRKVTQPTKKGIYIQSGRKVIIK